uniref:FHA domain-containing protein n=1 Tax=Glossina pallidipes TaxID=7398 RepID=A0A1B0A1N6_GLOPL
MCDESAIALLLDTEKQGFLLEKGRYYIIGHSSASRKSRNYIHLPDESLDAKHCLLEVRSYEEIFIVDLKSATGVHANGRQLQPLIKERVKLNEEFGLGDHLKVQIELIERAAICSLGTKAANESVTSVTNTAIQEEEPTRRLTRARARECEEATRRLTRARARARGLRHSGLADLGRRSGKSVKSNSTTKFSSKRLSL